VAQVARETSELKQAVEIAPVTNPV
jgi:hypothetical protein